MASLARTLPKPFATKTVHSSFDVHKDLQCDRVARVYRWDGLDGREGMGRGNKRFFQFSL